MKFVTLSAIALGTISCYANIITRDVDTQCNNGSIECCEEVKNYDDYSLKELSSLTGGLLGLDASSVLKGQLGLNCNPINVLLLGSGNQCSQQSVCCDQVSSSGLVGINCTPINTNL